MAKKESELALSDPARIINLQCLCRNNSSLVFLPMWSNIELDKNIRKFTSLVTDSLEEVQWSFNDN
jgi:hypothetical protein